MEQITPSKIYNGDCLEILKTFPDESIDVCITSPPYYGLRDYGTGTWVGGDPNCPLPLVERYGLSGVIENEPTIEAIPIEWIEKWLDEFLGAKLEEDITNLDPFKKNVYQGILLMYNDWRRSK